MARLNYVEPDAVGPELRPLVERIKSERGGQVYNIFRTLLNSPAIAEGFLGMGTAVRYRSTLDGHSRELAICLVGSLLRAEYEFHHHAPLARSEGVTQAQLDVLPDWRLGGRFDAKEQAVLAYAEAMTVLVEVDEPTFAAVREHFNDQEIMELTATIAFYNMVCRLLVALEIELEA